MQHPRRVGRSDSLPSPIGRFCSAFYIRGKHRAIRVGFQDHTRTGTPGRIQTCDLRIRNQDQDETNQHQPDLNDTKDEENV